MWALAGLELGELGERGAIGGLGLAHLRVRAAVLAEAADRVRRGLLVGGQLREPPLVLDLRGLAIALGLIGQLVLADALRKQASGAGLIRLDGFDRRHVSGLAQFIG